MNGIRKQGFSKNINVWKYLKNIISLRDKRILTPKLYDISLIAKRFYDISFFILLHLQL